MKFVDVETGQSLYEQQFFGEWKYKEYAEHEFQMARKSRVYMLHETIIDRAIESIINEEDHVPKKVQTFLPKQQMVNRSKCV